MSIYSHSSDEECQEKTISENNDKEGDQDVFLSLPNFSPSFPSLFSPTLSPPPLSLSLFHLLLSLSLPSIYVHLLPLPVCLPPLLLSSASPFSPLPSSHTVELHLGDTSQ